VRAFEQTIIQILQDKSTNELSIKIVCIYDYSQQFIVFFYSYYVKVIWFKTC